MGYVARKLTLDMPGEGGLGVNVWVLLGFALSSNLSPCLTCLQTPPATAWVLCPGSLPIPRGSAARTWSSCAAMRLSGSCPSTGWSRGEAGSRGEGEYWVEQRETGDWWGGKA